MPTFEVLDNPDNEVVVKLVQFSTGQLNPEAKDALSFKCYKETGCYESSKKKRKLDINTELNGIKYTGQNHGISDHFSTETCDYYVAVHRKNADKMQVYPAELFQLKAELQEKIEDSSQESTYREKRNNLISQFGSGQNQRKVKKAKEEKIEESVFTTLSQSVPTPVKAEPGTSLPSDNTNESSSTAIPLHNRNASSPQDAYPLETLIPSWAKDSLKEQSAELMQATQESIEKWTQEKQYCPLVLSLLSSASLEAKRESQCLLIMHLHCLIYSYSIKASEMRKFDLYPRHWQGNVKKLLDEKFILVTKQSDGRKRRSRPQSLKDLLLSHILLTYMRICNFTIRLKPLVAELKIPMKRLLLQCQMLGCRTKSGSGEVGDAIAELKIPLTFPDPKKKPYKRQ